MISADFERSAGRELRGALDRQQEIRDIDYMKKVRAANRRSNVVLVIILAVMLLVPLYFAIAVSSPVNVIRLLQLLCLLHLLQHGEHLRPGQVDARQMGNAFDAVLMLHRRGDLQGFLVIGTAACAEGDADKIRVQIPQSVQSPVNGVLRRGGLGRKDLKGQPHPAQG